MKYLALVAGLMGAVGVAVGCSSSDKHPGVVDGGGGKGGVIPNGGTHSGGTSTKPVGGDGDAQGGAGGAGAPDGLVVTISTPNASSDPNKDDVIITDTVTVTCAVDGTALGVKVDPSTVTLEVLGADGNPAIGIDNKPLSAPGVPTGNADEYSSSFPMGSIATGVVSFRCSAKALQSTETGTTTISTFVDHGPTIVAMLPKEGSAHALKGVLPVQFTVTPTPVADGDEGATIDAVTLQVAGVPIDDITEDKKNPGTWNASVDFTDKVLFMQPPSEHTSVHIEASNVRKPTAVTAIKDYPIVVDGKGPAIAYTSPKDNAAVHGETVIVFTAADTGAGLDIDTLELSVTGLPSSPVKFDATQKGIWSRNGDTFTFRFDTAVLVAVDSQVIVSIRAQDAAGNLTDGVTLLLYRDDNPPAIDLDPGDARVLDNQKACSEAFDPLGAALNDPDKTSVSFNLLRALVYDEANLGSGQTTLYFAGTDQGSVRMYAQAKTAEPFLVDTNNDGVCDSLAQEDFPYQSLKPVSQAGQLQYSKTDFATAPAVDAGGATCALRDPAPPFANQCFGGASDMWTVVGHDVATSSQEPIVYAMGGLQDPECTGSKWDFSLIPNADGWICLAARATDKLGNVGISRPLRVCYDNPKRKVGDPVPTCVTNASEPPPSCTTACTAPPRFPAHIYHY